MQLGAVFVEFPIHTPAVRDSEAGQLEAFLCVQVNIGQLHVTATAILNLDANGEQRISEAQDFGRVRTGYNTLEYKSKISLHTLPQFPVKAPTNSHKSHTQTAEQADSFQTIQAWPFQDPVVQLYVLQHVRVLGAIRHQHQSPVLLNMRNLIIVMHNLIRHEERQRWKEQGRSNVLGCVGHRDV